ncbi:type IV secretory pathway VirD2 relaxase [Sphingomonas zeicaulis]|uniref:relaxase/mobilization nuclease RlxS n=1 Tax=Sphingomonas zeicaulis TaxID=1632740 RepID=UPI003D1BEEC3
MSDGDFFEPELGRMRALGDGRLRFRNRVLAASNLARGSGRSSVARKAAFSGSRAGRGAGAGRLLSARDRHAAFRARRVLVKTRLVKLAGKGAAGAAAHLRYIQRDGVTRDGQPGALYSADGVAVDGKAFLARSSGDRHQFRLIVSAEDGAAYEDLKPLTRRLMAQMEADLGTRLDWVAVDHHNTGHPHTHIMLRGKDDRGHDLVIARDYLSHGIRERAAELVALDLGPRTDREIEDRLRAEVDQERFTSIDRSLVGRAGDDGIVTPGGDAFTASVRTGRLVKLQHMGLAERLDAGRWRLAEDLEAVLRQAGERGDIIRTMQRAYARAEQRPVDMQLHPAGGAAGPVVGRVIERGLANEHADRHYLIVDGTDGRSHYVEIGKGDGVDAMPSDAIVRLDPRVAAVRDVDRTVAAVAAANGGIYDADAHLRHDPSATQAFAETHERRLEALRRGGATVERRPDGKWTIGPDHLDQAIAFEARQLRDRPVDLEVLSHRPLAALPGANAATWLDRELAAPGALPRAASGFGAAVEQALAQRRRWLLAQALAVEGAAGFRAAPGALAALQERELRDAGTRMAAESGRAYRASRSGDRIAGTYRGAVDLASGRFAIVEQSREFTLVPWRPVLERQLGKPVSGLMRDGGINWTLGKGRPGPTIS